MKRADKRKINPSNFWLHQKVITIKQVRDYIWGRRVLNQNGWATIRNKDNKIIGYKNIMIHELLVVSFANAVFLQIVRSLLKDEGLDVNMPYLINFKWWPINEGKMVFWRHEKLAPVELLNTMEAVALQNEINILWQEKKDFEPIDTKRKHRMVRLDDATTSQLLQLGWVECYTEDLKKLPFFSRIEWEVPIYYTAQQALGYNYKKQFIQNKSPARLRVYGVLHAKGMIPIVCGHRVRWIDSRNEKKDHILPRFTDVALGLQ